MAKAIRPPHKKSSIPPKRILSALENNMTVPDPRYGDSIKKIKAQIPGLLNSLGLPAEPADIRAAAILSGSGMEVNAHNLASMKELDGQIGKLTDSLHPTIAESLLESGQNPLETPLGELQAYIDSFGGRYEGGDFIAALRNIKPDMRAAVISLHKVFSIIKRNGGAALGYALKSGNTATLGDLLNMAAGPAARISYIISDETPITQSVMHENSIRSEIKRACAYGKALLTD